MKILNFYKLYNWIIEEMGLSADAGIIAVIHSFSEMGRECRMSYADFADVLKVSRRKAIDRVKRLRADGYITATATGSDESGPAANVYTVNYAKFEQYHPSDETVTTLVTKPSLPSDETVTTLVTKPSLPSDETVTTLVTDSTPPTITENEKRSRKERGTERARGRATAHALTDAEKNRILYGFDYSGTGKKTGEYFIARAEEYKVGFDTVKSWILKDGGKEIPNFDEIEKKVTAYREKAESDLAEQYKGEHIPEYEIALMNTDIERFREQVTRTEQEKARRGLTGKGFDSRFLI